MTIAARILDLEHATLRPLGEYPSHCRRCREVAETRELQRTCAHPLGSRQEVDITELGATRPKTLVNCLRCGAILS
jgi:hypothetical protein